MPTTGLMTGLITDKAGQMSTTHTTIESPLGDLTAVARSGEVIGLYFPHHWYMPAPSTFGAKNDRGFDAFRGRSVSTSEASAVSSVPRSAPTATTCKGGYGSWCAKSLMARR